MSVFLAFLFFVSNSPRLERVSVTNACRAANSWSSNTVSYLQRIVTGSDAGSVKLRQAFDLPYVTTTPAVELVSDETECGNAVSALNSFYTDGLSHSPVFLIRVGTTRFAINDGSLATHIFDTNYQYKLSLRGLD
jgi:hypothetical protein